MENKNFDASDSKFNTVDYEKNFLERYFQNQAKVKILKIQAKIEKTKDLKLIEKLKSEIKSIEQDLQVNMKFIDENRTDKEAKNNEKYEKQNIKSKNNEKEAKIFKFDINKTYSYKNVKIQLCLWTYLFEYQKCGVKWMIDLYLKKKGGILADEMGLGKTIQIITMISGLYDSKNIKNALIICPATLVTQWSSEFQKMAPWIKINQGRDSDFNKEGISIVGYEQYKIRTCKKKIDVVVLDEGHKIKNKDTEVTMAVKTIRCKNKFILTGTPIQNNLGELWSLFDFVNPGLLGTYITFNNEFEKRIKDKNNKERSYRYAVMLREVIEPYIMRRMKSEVPHNLPGKVDKVIFVGLSKRQNEMYIRALESDKIRSAILENKRILVAIDYLRKICNHPFLLKDKQCNESDEEEGLVEYSSKMSVMIEFLEKWKAAGDKVLIFSQTVKMLKIIEKVVKSYNYTYSLMSGKTTITKRNEIVSKFNKKNDGVFLFLLTTRVGGLGLNLVGANRIILYDPDWNPSTDTQAKERIYRFGQTSDVEIYRLICRNTIEEKVYQKQIYKDFLSKKILYDPRIETNNDGLLDLLSYYSTTDQNVDIKDYSSYKLEEDRIVNIKEEDKKEFMIMKTFNSKQKLTGLELIEYITRREAKLIDTNIKN